MLRPLVSSILAAAALAGCDPYDPDLGNDPFLCSKPDRTCPDGYVCDGDADDSICVVSQGPDVDASNGNFQCADDSSIEPNNDPGTAFITPLGDTAQTYSLVGLAVCPAGDKDHYRFRIATAGTNFEAQVTGVANRSPLSLQVLTASGVMVASGAPVTGSPQVVRIELVNRLAAENYVVLVQSSDSTQNNYDLTMKVCGTTPPCP